MKLVTVKVIASGLRRSDWLKSTTSQSAAKKTTKAEATIEDLEAEIAAYKEMMFKSMKQSPSQIRDRIAKLEKKIQKLKDKERKKKP